MRVLYNQFEFNKILNIKSTYNSYIGLCENEDAALMYSLFVQLAPLRPQLITYNDAIISDRLLGEYLIYPMFNRLQVIRKLQLKWYDI